MDIGELSVAIHGIQRTPQLSVDPLDIPGIYSNKTTESYYSINATMKMIYIQNAYTSV